MDLFVVPTIGFKLLYGFVIVRLSRRDIVWINVTTNPTAEWVARQITEAFPWDEASRYLIRDRDRIYGTVVTRRLRAMGIRNRPTSPAAPWQNGFAERLIGLILRECLDHVVIWSEAHLRRVLKSHADYYNGVRTHRSLHKDAPISRPVQRSGLYKLTRRSGRTSSPLRPCLGFRYTQAGAGDYRLKARGGSDLSCPREPRPHDRPGQAPGTLRSSQRGRAGTVGRFRPRRGQLDGAFRAQRRHQDCNSASPG
jgi:Integrase core domain